LDASYQPLGRKGSRESAQCRRALLDLSLRRSLHGDYGNQDALSQAGRADSLSEHRPRPELVRAAHKRMGGCAAASRPRRGGGKEWGQAARERVGEREGGSGRSRLSGSRRRRQAPWRTCSMCPWASRRHRRGDRSSGASWRLQPVWTGGQSPVPSCFRPC